MENHSFHCLNTLYSIYVGKERHCNYIYYNACYPGDSYDRNNDYGFFVKSSSVCRISYIYQMVYR